MSEWKFLLGRALSVVVLLLAAQGLAAAPRTAQPDFLLRTPEARAQDWRDGLLKFVAEHRDLTREQAYTIEKLAAVEDLAAFANVLQPHERGLFAKSLDELGRVLSYRDYLGLLRSLDYELRGWLVRNGLSSPVEVVVYFCNCTTGAGGCSVGYSCQSWTCIHEGGTTHNGRCG